MIKRLLFLAILCMTFACSEDDDQPDSPVDNFDRQAVLFNWADNFIIPGYTQLSNRTEILKVTSSLFVENPNDNSYQALALAWEEAYLQFQDVSMFEIGKAEELRLTNNLNIYPTDVDALNDNVLEGNYNLELPSQIATQGFPALDYLLFGISDDQESIINFYQSDANASAYLDYIKVLATRIDDLVQATLDDWNSGYRDAFVNNTGNSATASVDKLVNDYIFYYERHLRAGKVGIPAGIFSGSPLPQNVEAFYREDFSKELFNQALDAAQQFFNGNHESGNPNNESLKSYLDYLEVQKDEQRLSKIINDQFNAARLVADELNNDFSAQVENDNTKMLALYDQLQLNVVPLKVDMLQALNINVDFVDADGD
jgi:predicted lipoprotein